VTLAKSTEKVYFSDMTLTKYLPSELLEKFEVHNFRHAAEVLSTSCPEELAELMSALAKFEITTADILAKGGNESRIPKKLSAILRPARWFETRIRGDLVITVETHRHWNQKSRRDD